MKKLRSDTLRIRWLRLIQVLGTLVLCIVLAQSIDWQTFRQSIITIRWSWITLAALFLLGAHYANILRWRVLLHPIYIPFETLTAYYGAGFFSNNFLPTGIGGDGVRAALVSRHMSWPCALVSVALDRGIGLLGLVVLVLPGLWLGLPPTLASLIPSMVKGSRSYGLLALLFLGLIGSGLLVYRRCLRRHLARYFPFQVMERLSDCGGRRINILGTAYGLGVGSNVGTVAAHGAVLYALTGVLSPGAAIWVALISSLALVLPISVNGLGVVESVFVLVLGAYGFAAPTALAVALLMRGLSLIYSLLGGLLSLRLGHWGAALAMAPIEAVTRPTPLEPGP